MTADPPPPADPLDLDRLEAPAADGHVGPRAVLDLLAEVRRLGADLAEARLLLQEARRELAEARQRCEGLAERVATQSQLLARAAERAGAAPP